MNNSISLIGMAGAGKSSIGQKLAKRLDFNFIDSDLAIERKYSKSLQEILTKNGNRKFKEIEEDVLLSVKFNQVILATGGSAVFCESAMEYIKANSMVVYLEVSYEDIKTRIPDFSERGLIKKSNQSVQDAYNEREGLYRKYADNIVKNNRTYESCLNKILKLI
tara:strand:- start:18230 stop:18721 length:492 start_codon:yes stop_codon:yes gene_type:complete